MKQADSSKNMGRVDTYNNSNQVLSQNINMSSAQHEEGLYTKDQLTASDA